MKKKAGNLIMNLSFLLDTFELYLIKKNYNKYKKYMPIIESISENAYYTGWYLSEKRVLKFK